eukprot:gene14489-30844_t
MIGPPPGRKRSTGPCLVKLTAARRFSCGDHRPPPSNSERRRRWWRVRMKMAASSRTQPAAWVEDPAPSETYTLCQRDGPQMNHQAVIAQRSLLGEPGVAALHDTNGRWVAGPTRGRYDSRGRWIAGDNGYANEANGSWSSIEQPGYYDTNGRWRAGKAYGYYDSRGRWVSTRNDNYGDNTNYQPGDGQYNMNQMPTDIPTRISWLREYVRSAEQARRIDRSDANYARTELRAIESQNRMFNRDGRFTQREERTVDKRLDRLTKRLDRNWTQARAY